MIVCVDHRGTEFRTAGQAMAACGSLGELQDSLRMATRCGGWCSRVSSRIGSSHALGAA